MNRFKQISFTIKLFFFPISCSVDAAVKMVFQDPTDAVQHVIFDHSGSKEWKLVGKLDTQ